jgi:hypothetical protein
MGNAVGAAVKFLDLGEITSRIVDDAINLRMSANGLNKGQIELEFEINYELIKALEKSNGLLDLDLIIRLFGNWFEKR